MRRLSPIRLDNGVEGIVFLRMHLSEVIEFIQSHRESANEVIHYLPKDEVFVFGKDSSYIMEGDSIIYVPNEDSFHLTRNPNWIKDYYFR